MTVSTNLLFLSLAFAATNALAASCGAAPSGMLQAERVAAVTASRAEPGSPGSYPASTCIAKAQSSTVRVSGPA